MRRLFVYLHHQFSNFTLKKKILFIVLFNSLAIMICAGFGYQLYTQVYNRLLYDSIAGNLSMVSYQISENMENVEYISSLLLSSSSIQKPLSNPPDAEDSIAMAEYNRQINNALQDYSTVLQSRNIAYLAIYNPKFANCTNWALLEKTPDYLLETAKENGEKRQGSVTWTYAFRQPYMLLSRNIRQIENMSLKHLGNLVIAVDLGKLVSSSANSMSLYQDQAFIIADESDQIIYASESLSNQAAQFFLSKMPESYKTISYDGHNYFVVGGTLPHYQFKYITLISFDEISNIRHFSTGMIFLIFIIGFLLIFLLSSRLIRQIIEQFNGLIRKMERFTQNELELSEEDNQYCSQQNEIGALHRQFIQMAHRIQHLVQVNYVNEILTKDAQLKALKSQINPHFLYNTLETINWRAKAIGDSTISQMVESLGTLLRASLSNRKPLVSVAYELELVDSYITIQQIRFENRLAFQVNMDPEAARGIIPPLTIQPLVENAIRYGLEEMTEICHLYLEIHVKDNLLIVQMKNEGSYFEDNLLEKLKQKQKNPHGFGIGLLNIDQRIKLLFSKEYGLSLSNEDGYAVATITLPFQEEGADNVKTTNRG